MVKPSEINRLFTRLKAASDEDTAMILELVRVLLLTYNRSGYINVNLALELQAALRKYTNAMNSRAQAILDSRSD